ncbi:hypothetical protein LA52FAK_45250 [Desulforhopalus sp. 52FAK]
MIQVLGAGRNCLLTVGIVVLLLLMSGCAMKNQRVGQDKRVTLAGKTTAAETYKNGPLTVNYEYKRVGDTLTISGSVGFPRSVDSLDVRIFFLDAEGLVIGKSLVYSSGYRSLAGRGSARTFRRNVDIPDGTVSFSFDETSRDRTSRR